MAQPFPDINTLASDRLNKVLRFEATRANLCVLVDSKFFTFIAMNSVQPTFLEVHITWKLEIGTFLPIFSPVQLFGAVGNTSIYWHI